MTFNKGSLILVDYTAKIKDSDSIFDTTIEADALKHSLHDPNVKYNPKIVSIGEQSFPVLEGLDEALANSNVGDKLTVEIPPEKGFGERDTGKVRIIPLRKLGDDADKVSVGDSIDIDGKHGIVRHIGSGRVQIDYNHRHAGKTLVYDVNVKKSLDLDDDKIGEILKYRIPAEDSQIEFKKSANSLDVIIPKEIFRMDGLHTVKHFIQMDIFQFLPDLEKINFIETHSNKKPEPEQKTEQKPNETTEQETKQKTSDQKAA